MNTKRLPWFRMYTDFLNDPKMISLAFEDQRHFIGILALKSDGALEQILDESLIDRIVAQRLWVDHGVIRDVKKRLVSSGLIRSDWNPVAWDKRQMNSDKDETNAQRQQRYRDNHQTVKTTVNALRNASVTGIDTDTDKEVDKKNTKQLQSPDGVLSSVWSDFLQIRKTKKAAVTQTAIDGIAREAIKAGLSLNDALAMCCERGWSGFKAEWLDGSQSAKPATHESFRERDAKAGRARWEEMTGQIHPDNLPKNYINVQASNILEIEQ